MVDAYWSSVVLALPMDGDNASTSFGDLKGKIVTRYGDTTISTAISKFGGASAYFDGAGDYLQAPSSTDFDFGTGDFTIECWFYYTSTSSDRVLVCRYSTWSASVGYYLGIRSGTPDIVIFRAGNSIPINIDGNTSLTTSAWNHVAVCRSSGVTKMYLNGVAQTASHTGSVAISSTAPVRIGANLDSTAAEFFNGYIDDLRITKGVARYTADFTPATISILGQAPIPIDTQWDNVVLALPMDGINASTAFVDLKGKAVTPSGNAQISTSQSKFGGASAYFDGNGDYLSTPVGTALTLGSGNFTIECWVYIVAHRGGTKYPPFICSDNADLTGMRWAIAFTPDGKLSLNVMNSAGSWTNCGPSMLTALSTGVWHHVAVVRNGMSTDGIKLYVDGTIIASSVSNPSLEARSVAAPLVLIGGAAETTYGGAINGYIDDLRITKGVARYTANFTPPVSSYFNSYITVSAGLISEYADAPFLTNACLGVYSLVMEQGMMARYGDASLLSTGLVGRYGDTSFINAALISQYGDTLPVLASIEGRYNLMHSVLSAVEGYYSTTGTAVLSALESRYDLRQRDEITSALVSYYSLLPEATVQILPAILPPVVPGAPPVVPNTPPVGVYPGGGTGSALVLIGGMAVRWSSVQWTISEDSYLIEANITLRDSAEFASIARMDTVTIDWQGTVYTLFVASKLRARSASGSPGAIGYGVDYTIIARSLTAALDEPYALPTTMSWPAATMASTIAAQILAPLADIISLDWRLEDWLQPGGTFFLTDETPLAGIRKLAGIVGGILQTSPANAMIIRKADPVPPREWSTTSPSWTIEDSGLFSDSESEDISSLYNTITITNQSTSDSSIRFETEEVTRYRHRVKGYRVPWVDFILATSGGAWVTIEDEGVVTEQIVETVEFIDGNSTASKPVHSAVSATWLRSQLGAITASEDGSLTAETMGSTLGCSLAEITYTTQYHAWIGRTDRDEEVQFYAVELP